MIKLDRVPYKIRDGKKIYDWTNSIGATIDIINEETNEVITVSIIRYEKRNIIVLYNDKEIPISTGNIENCKGGKILGKYIPDFRYEVGQIIGNNLKIIDRKKRNYVKSYKVHCIDCGYEIWKQEGNIIPDASHRCTIPTTDPWMIPYFEGGYDEANKYTAQSNKKIKPICPYCGMQSKTYKKIGNIYLTHGFQCTCSDNISYGEKFFISFLNQIGVKYTYQFYGEWNNRYYDFYIPSLKAVTEIHGEQHYLENDGFTKRTLVEEQENDRMKEETALQKEFIERYFVIDARKSTKEWLKKHIKESELYRLLGSPKIDWEECHQYTIKNIVMEVCRYIMENPNLSPEEYANIFSVRKYTVEHYIKTGRKHFDWFTWEYYDKNIEIIRDNQVICVAHTFADAKRYIESRYNIHMLESEIRRTYNGEYKQYKGFQFREVA